MQNQQFNEDKAELDAHFEARVQSYIELGETPEQALISATKKFGATDSVARELWWRRVWRSPMTGGVVCAGLYFLVVAFVKAPWTHFSLYFFYAVYVWLWQRGVRALRRS
jgi:hypothetical protein